MFVRGTKIIFYYRNQNVHEIISSYYPMCISTVMGEVIGPGVHNNTHAMYQIQTIDLSYLKLYSGEKNNGGIGRNCSDSVQPVLFGYFI